jgi:hypothetical protein
MPLKHALQNFVKTFKGGRRLHSNCGQPIDLNKVYPTMLRPQRKPEGLWYGIDGSWVQWCLSEDWGTNQKAFWEIDLDESRLLRVSNLKQFSVFEQKYAGPDPLLEAYPDLPRPTKFTHLIRWSAVAEGYGGVEISPYLWAMRLDRAWYYPWDVASGCIWDLSMIREVRPFAVYNAAKDRFERTRRCTLAAAAEQTGICNGRPGPRNSGGFIATSAVGYQPPSRPCLRRR